MQAATMEQGAAAPAAANEGFYFVFPSYDDAFDALPQFESDRARELMAEAEAARQREQESFDRCDTDGCVSQWCQSITASEKQREAELANRGYLTIAPALLDEATGRIVCACMTIRSNPFATWQTQHVWIFKRTPDAAKREYVTDYKRESNFTKLGLRKVFLLVPAVMLPRHPGNITDEPRGLSGLASYHGKSAYIDLKAAGFRT